MAPVPGRLWPRWLFLRALGLVFLSAFYALAFQIHGWELVMSDVTPEMFARVKGSVRRATEISPGRYVMELSLEQAADRLLSELAGAGATLVSLNPMRDTLEDFFMRRVAEMGAGARLPLAEESGARD